MLAPNFNASFIYVIGLGFMQFKPQLTIKLSILFDFIPDFNKLSSYNLVFFAK